MSGDENVLKKCRIPSFSNMSSRLTNQLGKRSFAKTTFNHVQTCMKPQLKGKLHAIAVLKDSRKRLLDLRRHGKDWAERLCSTPNSMPRPGILCLPGRVYHFGCVSNAVAALRDDVCCMVGPRSLGQDAVEGETREATQRTAQIQPQAWSL